jgi:hypothetical protein
MTVTATSQPSPPDYPSEPGYSPEPHPVPLPPKETHRLRAALIPTTAVLAIGAISFLGVSLSGADHTIKSQAKKLSNQSVSLATLIKAAASEQKTIDRLQSKLDAQDEVPPGGYSAFQSDLISDISTNEGVTASMVDCVLPSTWTPGVSFNCNLSDANGTPLGSANIVVESNNPDGTPQWEFNWTAASSGYGGY